jgi:hypothetical protein
MARATYGAGLTDLKGSIGGTTFQHNYTGKIVRSRPVKSKTCFILLSGVEPAMLRRKSEWNLLSSTNKALWNTYALSYTKDNYYAETKTLNGFNWYASINNYLEKVSGPTVSAPPTRTLPLAVPTMTLTVDGNGIWFTPPTPYTLGNNALMIFTTRQTNTMFLKQRSLFRLTSIQTNGTVTGYNLKSTWQTAHKTTYPAYTNEMNFNIIAMFVHVEKSSGLVTVGTFAIDGINTLASGIGNMIIENNFIIS